ncbi:hypothetical protein [Arthrobacter sp. RCC_34]|uniref:hypothetical protein n=1 Tax=Arthrobacter sp. RCC_34 TaxID=3239230 RepID=UPI00352487C5
MFEMVTHGVEIVNHGVEIVNAIPNPTPEEPPGGGGFLKILGWGAWVVFGLAVLGILIVAGKMMIDNKQGHGGGQHAQALGTVLTGCIIASVASGIVGAIVTASGGLA